MSIKEDALKTFEASCKRSKATQNAHTQTSLSVLEKSGETAERRLKNVETGASVTIERFYSACLPETT